MLKQPQYRRYTARPQPLQKWEGVQLYSLARRCSIRAFRQGWADILVPEGTKMSALTVQVLRLSLSLGSVTAPTRIPPFCAYGAGKLDCECIHARLSLS